MKLIGVDDYEGLKAAARRVFDTTRQRCCVHWRRNVFVHAPAKPRTALAAMLATVFARENETDAEARWEVMADALCEKQARSGFLTDVARDDVLAHLDFPREHWTRIAFTNPLERVNRAIKRRFDIVGIFLNDRATACLVNALTLEIDDEWNVARRYTCFRTLACVTDTPTV